MNRDETNGYLQAVESQLWEVCNKLAELDARGDFTDEAWKSFSRIRVRFINISYDFAKVRGWNGSIDNKEERSAWHLTREAVEAVLRNKE